MRKIFTSRWIVPIAVFALGALSLIAYGITHRSRSAVARTVHYRQTLTSNEGVTVLSMEMVRYTNSEGFWKADQVYYNPDGSIKTKVSQFGSPDKKAAFQIDDEKKILALMGPIYHSFHTREMADVRRDPTFAKEDVVLGYPVAVFHQQNSDQSYVETYRSLDLDDALRIVLANSGGYDTLEAVSILLGEPTPEQLRVPDYPVSFELYKSFIKSADERGDKMRADTMRQALAELEKTLR